MALARVPETTTERLKAFTDGVVAIAMTLLILPLMEGVGEAVHEPGMTTLRYVQEHGDQLFSFLLSFVLIAMFWMNHHQLYASIEHATLPLTWLAVAWMLTIVWMPVPTALLGELDVDDGQKVVYIGSLMATAIVQLATRAYVLRHRELSTADPEAVFSGLVADVTMVVLYLIALVTALAIPDGTGYFAMFLLVLTGPVHAVVMRAWRRRRGAEPSGAPAGEQGTGAAEVPAADDA